MSVFKSRPSSIRLRIGRGEWTPLFVAAMLAVGVVVQLALPRGVTLPADSALAPRRPRMLTATAVPAYPAIPQAPIFAPDRAPGEQPVVAAPGQSPSLQLVGVALSGRSASAIVRAADGATRVLHPGESFKQWRLISIGADQAVFVGPGGRLVAPLGAVTTDAASHPVTSETP